MFHAASVPRLPAFRAFSATSAVAPFGARCSHAVKLAPSDRRNDLRSLQLRLQSFSPTLRPTSSEVSFDTPADRCSPGLPPLRGVSVPSADRSLPSRASSRSRSANTYTPWITPQGFNRRSSAQLRKVAPTSMRFLTSSNSPRRPCGPPKRDVWLMRLPCHESIH